CIIAAIVGWVVAAAALPPERLKAFIPDQLNGLRRTEVTIERNAAIGLHVSSARGYYSDGASRNLRLGVTDSGGDSNFMTLLGWVSSEPTTERSDSFKRTRQVGDRLLHEQWTPYPNGGGSGEYGVLLANRFVVKVSGSVDSMGELKSAVDSLNLAGL